MMRGALLCALLAAAGCKGGGSGDDDGADAGTSPDALPEPDSMPDAQIVPTVPPEIDGRIVINELMASNAVSARDETGAAGDWIELYNPTEVDIPLHGYCLTDDLALPRKRGIGDGVTLPAGGFVLLWLDDASENGPAHIDIKLASEGGDLALSRPDGSFIDRVRYGAQETDVSAAREPDGSDAWRIQWLVSPGTANLPGDGLPMELEDPEAEPEAVPAAGDLTVPLFDTATVVQFALEISDEGVASLLATPLTYVPANLVYQGRTYGPIGVRLKGGHSFKPFDEKPSFRINVDEFVDNARFLGLKDLTLNNMDDDPSMMHERLAYEFAREVGVPASRANHAEVTVNGDLYGLYAHVETVRKGMLARWFADNQGPLFEVTDADYLAAHIPLFELKSGPDDRSLLYGLADALTNADADAAIAAAGAFADIPQFVRFWAMCALIGQFDSFPYSDPGDDYFTYADPTTDRLLFIPWGMDETWFAPHSDPGIPRLKSVLGVACGNSPACYQAWVDQLWAMVDVMENSDYLAKQAAIATQIATYVAADTRKPYTTEDVDIYQEAVRFFMTERRTYLGTVLPPPSAE